MESACAKIQMEIYTNTQNNRRREQLNAFCIVARTRSYINILNIPLKIHTNFMFKKCISILFCCPTSNIIIYRESLSKDMDRSGTIIRVVKNRNSIKFSIVTADNGIISKASL